MNKNFLTVAILFLVIVGGGTAYFLMGRDGEVVSTPVVADAATQLPVAQNSSVVPNVEISQVGMPIVVTSSSAFTSDTTARVNGTVHPGGSLTSYWYEYGLDSKLGTQTPNQTIGSGFVTLQTPGYITKLTKNKKYYFRLVAENQYGRVAGSQYSFTTTEGSLPPMGNVPTVTTIPASGISKIAARINGEVTPNRAETGYWFEYGTTGQMGSTSPLTPIGSTGVRTIVSIPLSELDQVTTYYFRLNAQNQFGTVNGEVLTFTTK